MTTAIEYVAKTGSRASAANVRSLVIHMKPTMAIAYTTTTALKTTRRTLMSGLISRSQEDDVGRSMAPGYARGVEHERGLADDGLVVDVGMGCEHDHAIGRRQQLTAQRHRGELDALAVRGRRHQI